MAGLALAVGIGLDIANRATTPLDGVSAAAEKIAAGDLTVAVPETGYREAVHDGQRVQRDDRRAARPARPRGVLGEHA